MPAVQQLVWEIFGKGPADGPDPDHAIALGAAWQAGLVARDAAVDEVVVTDVTSHTLGVQVVRFAEKQVLDGYYLPVLHRNTTLPARRVEQVLTTHPKQTAVCVRVFQGEHRYAEQNRLLGEFTVTGIPPIDGPQPVDISFAHDLSGLLEVEATIVATGKKARIVIEQDGALTEDGRRRALARLARLARLKTPARERRRYKALLERALSFVFPLHAMLGSNNLNTPTNSRTLNARGRLWSEGVVTWGHVVLAAEAVRTGSQKDGTCLICYALDPLFERRPELLTSVNRRFWQMRNGHRGPGTRWPDESLLASWPDFRSRSLPRSLTEGRVVLASSAPLLSAHLPGAALADNLVPVVTLREPEAPVMILPEQWWTRSPLDEWQPADPD